MDQREALLLLFEIGIIGMLFFLILAALLRKKPGKLSMNELNKRFINSYRNDRVEEAKALNLRLENGYIDPSIYIVEMDILKHRLENKGISSKIIDKLIQESVFDQNDFDKQVLTNVVKLKYANKIEDNDFEERVNNLLDRMPRK